MEDGQALVGQGKFAEAIPHFEKAAEADGRAPEPVYQIFCCRAGLKQWEEAADALVALGRRVAFETWEPGSRNISEQLGLCVWSATAAQKIAVFTKLAREFPKSPWRVSWLSVCLTAYAREGREEDLAAVEEELQGMALDAPASYRVARAYLEGGRKPEKAIELLERALTLRGAAPLPEDALARETALTEMSVWRSYLAFGYRQAKRDGPGNPFYDAEPETSGFEDATESVGLVGAKGGRVAVGDFDGDGWDDLCFGGAVWRNAKGIFERLPEDSGLPDGGNAGALWADADNDGDLDLWGFSLERGARIWLQEKGRWTEAADTGMPGKLPASPEGAGLGDANGDGFLDAYVAVYEGGDLGGGQVDSFFLSNGRLHWVESLATAGMKEELAAPRCGRGVNWGDFDGDGDADIFVSNYRLERNYLWRNAGKGEFSNAAPELGVQGVGVRSPGNPEYFGHTIGSCWADLDNDLDLDLVSANLAHPRFIEFSNKTQVLMNQGSRKGWTFTDIFAWSGIPYEETHSDVSAADYDCDGDLDLYFTSVYPERPSCLVRNNGAAHFEPVTWRAGAVLFNGWGHAWLDGDNDGDLDLVVCAGGTPVYLRNDLEDGSSWLQVALRGKSSNASGIGARVRVHLGDLVQTREIAAGRGTTSQDTARACFGFGKRMGKATVMVTWPGGKTQRLEGVEINRLLTVDEE
jgi:hypothetical protein